MKIKIGKSSLPRRPFDASHDVHTTLDWGFMQPTCKLELVANSTIDCNIGSMCRLMPLVAPTFGRAVVKHYAYFVPLREVCYQYENLISRTGYNGANRTYIPTQVLNLNLQDLASVLLCNNFASINTFFYESKNVMPTGFDYHGIEPGAFDNVVMGRLLQRGKVSPFAHLSDFISNDDRSITLENADFIIDVGDGTTEGYELIAVKLNKRGRNLRKIFIGLGYQINFAEKIRVSFLPILAYYKAWFDLFAIKQKVNWQYTRAYNFIQQSAQNNFTKVVQLPLAQVQEFFLELSECYYTFNPDYFTCQQYELNQNNSGTQIDFVESFDYPQKSDGQIYTSTDTIGGATTSGLVTPWYVKGLLKMLPFINKDTIIGAKVRDRLRAHGYGSADDDKSTHFIGASSVNIDISDVMSTAETENANLGDYTGKGVGSGSSGSMKFSTSVPGYFIVLSTIVPRTGYFQGIDPNLFHGTNDEFDWYHQEWDAFGYQVTSGLEFIAAQNFSVNLPSRHTNFGLIPRYSEYKCSAHDIVNGDMSLRSRETELLPYHLVRLIGTAVTNYEYDSAGRVTDMSMKTTYVNSVNESLRYLGKDEVFGNFNRIFQIPEEDDGTFNYDGFILHNIFNIKIIAPMKPMSESYDTDYQENGYTVNKA
nr:MAG: major capsid protein [Microviridae sp.]